MGDGGTGMSWDRIQRLDLDLRLARVELEHVTAERDAARRVAMRLEQENHALAGAVCSVCGQHLVPVPWIGDAS